MNYWPCISYHAALTIPFITGCGARFLSASSAFPLRSVLRAMWAILLAGKTVQGGSTLTQQLAKNMYTNQQRSYLRKINEALIALVLDYRYSKDQILEAYLNEIFIGQFKDNPVHGLGLGSKLSFGKPLAELRPHEYALLIAVIKGPSFYDPRRFPGRGARTT